jgi:hypothetical protein
MVKNSTSSSAKACTTRTRTRAATRRLTAAKGAVSLAATQKAVPKGNLARKAAQLAAASGEEEEEEDDDDDDSKGEDNKDEGRAEEEDDGEDDEEEGEAVQGPPTRLTLRTQRCLNMATTPKKQQLPEKLTMRSTADDIWVSNWKLVLSYGKKADNWHLSYQAVAFKDGEAKENWKTFHDTQSFATFRDWAVEKMDRPDMCRLGFFCTWTEGWVGKRVREWKERAQWHAWAAAVRPISGQKQGKELIIWDSNCTITHPTPDPVYHVRLIGMQRNLVEFVGKRCQLVQVWVGGSGNGGKGKCMLLTQDWIHKVCKDYRQELPSGAVELEQRGFRKMDRSRPPIESAQPRSLPPVQAALLS